jgi:hypothetical protein
VFSRSWFYLALALLTTLALRTKPGLVSKAGRGLRPAGEVAGAFGSTIMTGAGCSTTLLGRGKMAITWAALPAALCWSSQAKALSR